jgi:hypothetical protein
LTEFISTRLGNPKLSPMVVVLGVFGAVLALFALAMRRASSLAKQWPVVSGTIKMSDIAQHRAAPTQAFSRGPMMYQRQVSYAYRYNNVAYSRAQATLATGVNSTSGWLARQFTTTYRDGASVDVHVNPANPSEATLNPRGGFVLIWILWLLAFAFSAAAYYVARVG